MNKPKVFSGYVRCCICKKHSNAKILRTGCPNCNKKHFEYGVLHRNKFMSYAKLKKQTKKGRVFIDGTYSLNITHKTFG